MRHRSTAQRGQGNCPIGCASRADSRFFAAAPERALRCGSVTDMRRLAASAALTLTILLLTTFAVAGPATAEPAPGSPRTYGTLLTYHQAKMQACKVLIRDGAAWQVWVRGNNSNGAHGHLFSAQVIDRQDEVRARWQARPGAGQVSDPTPLVVRRNAGWMLTAAMGELSGEALGGGWTMDQLRVC